MDKTQEQLARQWAVEYLNWANKETAPEIYAAAEIVLATIPAPPTMADVEWSDEEHFLAGATTIDGDEVTMIGPGPEDTVRVNYLGDDFEIALRRKYLTPNGKHYDLREVTATPHPEFLETPEDYKNAPEGTVVVSLDCGMWVKNRYGAWNAGTRACDNGAMAEYECQVLRWGEEA
ncbi:hypothetical protein [Corynebacterium riegelii]|uniref:hypothetical protein n=1 Tax=Corynebacterium riegelii TaxID=156976 RepID=UPI00288925EA|nr:hypothetical protein [Corynebacterium riegelii]